MGRGGNNQYMHAFLWQSLTLLPSPHSWDPRRGLKLMWRPGDSWFGRIRLPANLAFEAKVN